LETAMTTTARCVFGRARTLARSCRSECNWYPRLARPRRAK
jgi:hypothetical protein